jgi:hypothetical protein
MQKIVFMALLAGSLLAGAGSAFCQTSLQIPVPGAGPFSGKLPLRDSLRFSPLRARSAAGALIFTEGWDVRKRRPFDRYPELGLTPMMDSVRILSPDKMRCKVADLSRLEKMPVVRLQNQRPRDPMPNSLLRASGDAVNPYGRKALPKE